MFHSKCKFGRVGWDDTSQLTGIIPHDVYFSELGYLEYCSVNFFGSNFSTDFSNTQHYSSDFGYAGIFIDYTILDYIFWDNRIKGYDSMFLGDFSFPDEEASLEDAYFFSYGAISL